MTVIARRLAWAIAGGVLLYAGHAPWDQAWAGYVAVVPLLLLARDVSASPLRAARAGFGWGVVAGLVFFLPLLTWIGRFGVAPWVLLALMEACFVGAFVALLAAWGSRAWRPVVAVVAWVGLEWVRSQIPLGGFPWGALAYTQHDGGPVLPVARVLGALGVSAVLVAVAGVVEAVAVAVVARRWRSLVPAAGSLGLIVVLLVAVPAAPAPAGETIDMAAVQGNDVELPPFVDRSNTARVLDIADRMVEVTRRLASSAEGLPDVVVWPENALDSDPRSTPAVGDKVRQAQALIGDATLLAGALLDGDRPATFRNTIVRFGPEATVAEVYDKRILVPFGEYVPLRALLGGLPPLRAIPSDGIVGTEPKVFDIDGAIVGPITCYESLFPDLVRDQVRAGAQVLVVSTNNASFGRTPAAPQHLAFSQVRAVETGRWVLQAGISGISAVIDANGTASQETELFTKAIVRHDFPLTGGQTFFVRTGDVIGPLCALLTLIALGLCVARRRQQRDAQMAEVAGGR